ncbi:MAG: nitroreductase family protein [Desulfurococcaceae archaeon TW002]
MRCECFLETVLSRSSVRWFKSDPVPDDVLLKILEAGVRAPNAGNSEQWFFIVVRDTEVRKKLHNLLLEAHEFYATQALKTPLPPDKVVKWVQRIREGMYLAPTYIAGYIDLRKTTHVEGLIETEKVFAVQSVAAALENMLLVAHTFGLGAVWIGVPLLLKGKFDELLKPPEKCDLQGIIALGYPAEFPRTRPRKPLSEVVRFI